MVGSRWSCRRCWSTTRHDSIEAAARIYRQADRRNLFVKIPGTPEGVPAIEESIFAGVPINVTLLFSREQYRRRRRSLSAWHRTPPRRRAQSAGRVGRLAVRQPLGQGGERHGAGGPAQPARHCGRRIVLIEAYRELLASPRWRTLAAAGARPQRLLWASTGTKDPKAPETLYVEALAAPDTINTMPEKTLHAFAEHGELKGAMAEDGGEAEAVLARFARAGIDVDALATQLQRDGAQTFVKSWQELLQRIDDKSVVLAGAAQRTG